MSEMDDFDVAILRCLQDDNRMTSEAIAEQVGLSPTACQRRMRKLRQSGAIMGDVSIIDPERVGGRMIMIVQVVLERGRADIVDAFKRDVRRTPEIQQCYYVTGDADFVLVVTAKDMVDYERLTRRIFFENPNIQKFHTMVVMEAVKAGLKFPL